MVSESVGMSWNLPEFPEFQPFALVDSFYGPTFNRNYCGGIFQGEIDEMDEISSVVI